MNHIRNVVRSAQLSGVNRVVWVIESLLRDLRQVSVRGALLTKESDSSFAEAHKGILSEPTHIEGEDEDQEDEVEDERDCEECQMEGRREVRHTSA